MVVDVVVVVDDAVVFEVDVITVVVFCAVAISLFMFNVVVIAAICMVVLVNVVLE